MQDASKPIWFNQPEEKKEEELNINLSNKDVNNRITTWWSCKLKKTANNGLTKTKQNSVIRLSTRNLDKTIFGAEEVINRYSRLPSSISVLIKLFVKPKKHNGMQTRENIAPNFCTSSWELISVRLNIQKPKNKTEYFIRLYTLFWIRNSWDNNIFILNASFGLRVIQFH